MRWCVSHESSSSTTEIRRKPPIISTAPAMAAALAAFLLVILLPLSFAQADSELLVSDGMHLLPVTCPDDPALLQELDLAKRHLHDLEQTLSEKDLAIQIKDKAISSLQSELEDLKKKESLQYDNVLEELGSKVARLEDDLEKAELELKDSKVKVKSLETAQSLYSSKIKELEKLVSEQKIKIAKAEQALRVAKSTLLRVQQEADAKDKELRKVHGGWLPPWTSIKLVELQAFASKHWIKYGKPYVDTTMKKASEKVSAAQTWSKPYIDNLKSNWSPVLKRSTEAISATVTPHFETAKSKMVKGYQTSKDFILPQLEKVQDVVAPHLKAAKETCKPYVEEVAAFVRPHFKRVQSVTKPYTGKISQNYRKFLLSATTYHSQLQESMKGKMQKVDFLAPLANNELVWFLSAALLVLPIIFTYLFFSTALGPRKKPVKAAKSHHGGHTHKKAKRSKLADK